MFSMHYSTNGIPIMAGNRVVGQVSKGRFVKRCRGSRHMLREPRGWAVDVQSLMDARDVGAEVVEILDTETGVTYSASIEQVVAKGFRLNRGHGAQICLPLRFWCVHRPGEVEQLTLALA